MIHTENSLDDVLDRGPIGMVDYRHSRYGIEHLFESFFKIGCI